MDSILKALIALLKTIREMKKLNLRICPYCESLMTAEEQIYLGNCSRCEFGNYGYEAKNDGL